MPRILVIDDDPVILEVITKILKTNSYEVIAAPDGKSGIKKLESASFSPAMEQSRVRLIQ